MRRIVCKEYTGLNCSFVLESSGDKKIKQLFHKHLDERHSVKEGNQYTLSKNRILEIMSRLDTELMRYDLSRNRSITNI